MSARKDFKIFLVDDDAFCLNLYQQFLIKLGYNDISCYNGGQDCLNKISERPDIIFLDYNMEEMNGIDVLQSIRTSDKDVAVVFISGQESVEVAVDALKYGAFDYIVKSKITLELLRTTIDRIAAEKGITHHPTKKGFFGRMKSNLGI
ncbi:MAG: response regulator [Chitinophagaceae bacterium]|nr:response regulator [Chitinophagaceae bacterium]